MVIHAVRDVDHAATGRLSRGPETFVVMKVEDVEKGKTKATRTDKWTDEIHNVDIEKANEIELTVYDKSGARPTPIGMLWIRISDIAEEMRRKKIESELGNSQWVTADRMDNSSMHSRQDSAYGSNAPSIANRDSRGSSQRDLASHPPNQNPTNPSAIEAWFALEPVGRIHLTMSFTKQNKDRRPFDIGLNRKGAIRQRKEEIHELYGHKFVLQQFYNIMRCALCGEFLKYSAGMQCEDCKYTCHKKCYPKVVTKCISKSNAETDPDEEKVNHRIPHRFEPFSNMGANWCCHCGYILPIGRKNCRKCSGTSKCCICRKNVNRDRMWPGLSRGLCSSRTRLLWDVHGGSKSNAYYGTREQNRATISETKFDRQNTTTKRQIHAFSTRQSLQASANKGRTTDSTEPTFVSWPRGDVWTSTTAIPTVTCCWKSRSTRCDWYLATASTE